MARLGTAVSKHRPTRLGFLCVLLGAEQLHRRAPHSRLQRYVRVNFSFHIFELISLQLRPGDLQAVAGIAAQ